MLSRVMLTAFLAFLLPINVQAACVKSSGAGFVLKGGEATDRKSGLTWKRCAAGMRWNAQSGRCSGEALGLKVDDALEFAKKEGGGWRVPTGEELQTLFTETCEGAWANTVVFPDLDASDFGEGAEFWSSTEALPNMFYYFNFTDGYADMHSKGFHLSLLLVK